MAVVRRVSSRPAGVPSGRVPGFEFRESVYHAPKLRMKIRPSKHTRRSYGVTGPARSRLRRVGGFAHLAKDKSVQNAYLPPMMDEMADFSRWIAQQGAHGPVRGRRTGGVPGGQGIMSLDGNHATGMILKRYRNNAKMDILRRRPGTSHPPMKRLMHFLYPTSSIEHPASPKGVPPGQHHARQL